MLLCVVLPSCKKVAPPPAPPPTKVMVTHPVQREVTDYLYFNGVTRGIQQTGVRPRISGYLEKVNFKADTHVNAGDLLFTIDQREYKVAVERAQADLLGKKAKIDSAQSDMDRTKKLVAQGAAADQELLDKKASYDLAQADVLVSKAELDSAKLNLDFTEVRAPISGRVSRNLVDEGTLVKTNDTLLATIVNDDTIYAYFNVSEQEYLDYLRKHPKSRTYTPDAEDHSPVDLAMADEDNWSHHGYVLSGDNTVDVGTATFEVRATFDNTDKQIAPGLYVRLRADMGTTKALLVPDIALQADQRGQYVYVVDDQNIVQRRSVKTGPQVGAWRRIINGVEPTDKVIFNGLMMVRMAAVVDPQDAPPPPLPTTVPSSQPGDLPAGMATNHPASQPVNATSSDVPAAAK